MRQFTIIYFTIGFTLFLMGCSSNIVTNGTTDKGIKSVKEGGVKANDLSVTIDSGISNADQSSITDGIISNQDASPKGEAGLKACGDKFASCDTFEDATSSTANHTIKFGGDVGDVYQPKCLKIKVGQEITFSGSFADHPLTQSCGPTLVIMNGTGTSAKFAFTTPGTYGYYCRVHGSPSGLAMAGAIQVVQ